MGYEVTRAFISDIRIGGGSGGGVGLVRIVIFLRMFAYLNCCIGQI